MDRGKSWCEVSYSLCFTFSLPEVKGPKENFRILNTGISVFLEQRSQVEEESFQCKCKNIAVVLD